MDILPPRKKLFSMTSSNWIIVIALVMIWSLFPRCVARPQGSAVWLEPNMRLAPPTLTYPVRLELGIASRRHPDNSTHTEINGFVMIPLNNALGSYSGTAYGVHLIGRYTGQRAEIAAGPTLLFPGFEAGIGYGAAFVFDDTLYSRRNYSTRYNCDRSSGDECYRVHYEPLYTAYLNAFNAKSVLRAELHVSEAFRNYYASDPLYYDGWCGNIWYTALGLVSPVGDLRNGVSVGGMAERNFGIGPRAQVNIRPVHFFVAYGRDNEEKRPENRNKWMFGAGWNGF